MHTYFVRAMRRPYALGLAACLSSASAVQAAETDGSDFAAFDRLKEQGTLIKVPSTRDTLLGDSGGLRSTLAEHGIGFMLISLNSAAYDLSSPVPAHPQRYNGQDLTANGIQQLLVTYDLGQHGNDQSQLIVGVTSTAASWEPLGPRSKAALSRFAYYRSFNNRQWELKVGYLSNTLEYVGVATGGSLTGGAQGPNAIIPYQLGLARLPMAAPGLNLQYNGKNGFYDKFGLQRSTSPDGAQAEVDAHSDGFRFRTPHSNLLLINEIGLKREATASRQQIWLRAGAIMNSSDFRRFDAPGRSDGNHAFYAAADVQLTLPPERNLPFQGWYAGASINDAPQDRNLYSRYYEARLYRIGTFARRPVDMLSMTWNHSRFSEDAGQLFAERGLPSESSTRALTVSYMARLHAGAYLSAGLSQVKNPAFSPRMDDALNLMLGLNLFF